jgi:hypothetical protein
LSSSWEHLYRAVIFEPDPEKVPALAEEAERAIKARMREIMDESITALDMTELSNALRIVRDLRHRSDH